MPQFASFELEQAISRPLTFDEIHSLEIRVKRLQELWAGPIEDLSEIGLLISVEMPRLISVVKSSLPNVEDQPDVCLAQVMPDRREEKA